LEESIRPSDFAARYGGEEFAVILPRASEEEAAIVAERIRKAILSFPWKQRAVTASIGVACLGPNCDIPDFIDQADGALYASKANGRNRVTISTVPAP